MKRFIDNPKVLKFADRDLIQGEILLARHTKLTNVNNIEVSLDDQEFDRETSIILAAGTRVDLCVTRLEEETEYTISYRQDGKSYYSTQRI